jgi:hypothetical protein
VETDLERMAAAMLAIPGARMIEARETDHTLDLLIETDERAARCPRCAGTVEASRHRLEDLEPSSVGGRVSRAPRRIRASTSSMSGCSGELARSGPSAVAAFRVA